MLKMNKAELVEFVSNKTGFTKTDSEAALNAVLKGVKAGLKKGNVGLVGFGTFKYVKTKARKGVNPQTGAPIKIPAKKVIRFRPSKVPTY